MQRWEEKAEANAIEPMAVSGVFRHLCAMGGNTCKRSPAVVDAPHARWQPKKLGACTIPVLSTLGGMVITEGGDVGSAATVPPSSGVGKEKPAMEHHPAVFLPYQDYNTAGVDWH